MAELVTLARPYAEGVFRLAREKNALAAWSEMLALLEIVVTDPRVRAYADDPGVSAAQLEALIVDVAGDKIDALCRNFVRVLIDNGRLELLPQIRSLYEALRHEHEGVVEARIVSAMPLAEEQLRPLLARLEARYQRKVTATVELDPQLIGGVRIVVGDTVIDATVRGKLEAMAAALTH
ncbi:MAG: F0F1 ATP synthase subunit delta [Burkholderiales bacterium]